MKTKFKYLTLLAVALFLGFSSCSNDDDHSAGTDPGTPKSIFLKIKGDAAISPFSEGPSHGATQVGFSDGELYFVNGSGSIIASYSLSSSATAGNNISLSDIQTGTTINNLPGSVVAVHVVGNRPAEVSYPTLLTNISQVENTILEAATQSDISQVSLYGHSALVPPATQGENYTCNVNLNPIVARLELADMKATGSIASFKVEGIFIDKFYTQSTVGGNPSLDYLRYIGADNNAFMAGTAQYPAALSGITYDGYPAPLESSGNPALAKPVTDGDVWAYNLFAPVSSGTVDNVPRIIIRLSDIQTNNGTTISGTQYLTIKGLRENGTLLTGIQAGKIYKIGTGVFSFDETNLTTTPNLNTIDVEVKVTLATWSIVDVTPDI